MKTKRILSGLLILLVSSTGFAQKTNKITVGSVKTANGIISGTTGQDSKVMAFKGIPYAAPPLADLRWKEPQPVKNWQGVRKCDTFGPIAPQKRTGAFPPYTTEMMIPAEGTISEDCLYLNVWTTAKSTNDKRPVIVFIHGGSFGGGSGSISIYDGESMAAKGVVFVTINYRIGGFGFFAHPELTKESPNHASGNYGILDQIAALKWVKKNIASFGGNPDNVTIAGQSAGSMSVNVLDASPLAKGLFHKIIAESGAFVVNHSFFNIETLENEEKKGAKLMKDAGITSIAELRKLPADQIITLDKVNMLPAYEVNIDGYVLPEHLIDIYAKGKQTDVPLLTGWNAGEKFPMRKNLSAYNSYLSDYGVFAEKLKKAYPATNDAEAKKAMDAIARDRESFGFQNYAWARIQSEKGKSKAFVYFFNRDLPEEGGTHKFGAFHTSEVPFAYGNLKKFSRPWTPADYQLSNLMQTYWVNFATKGDPNGAGVPVWPAFNKDKGEVMNLDVESKAIQYPTYEGMELFYQHATSKTH